MNEFINDLYPLYNFISMAFKMLLPLFLIVGLYWIIKLIANWSDILEKKKVVLEKDKELLDSQKDLLYEKAKAIKRQTELTEAKTKILFNEANGWKEGTMVYTYYKHEVNNQINLGKFTLLFRITEGKYDYGMRDSDGNIYSFTKNENYKKSTDWTSDYEFYLYIKKSLLTKNRVTDDSSYHYEIVDTTYYFNCMLPGKE